MAEARSTGRWPRAALIAAAAVAMVSCSTPGLIAGGTAGLTAPAERCGAPSHSCNLPFPSDSWLVPDATTATGVRVSIPRDAVPRSLTDQLGPRDQIVEAETGADGFSPLTPIAFQLPDALEARHVPDDGGELVVVWDADTGQRVPIRVELSDLGVDERGARNVIVAWPRTRYDYGHRIVGVVRRGLLNASGQPAAVAPSLERASAATREAVARLDPAVAWSDHLSATSFVTRSEASIVGDVDRMAAWVRADDHPVRNLEVRPSLIGGSVAVSGQLRATDFRAPDGVITRDGSAMPNHRWIDFLLVLPGRPATAAGAPVAIYGHGITIFKESMAIVAAQNAAKGFATIGIDLPNHGSRSGDGGHVLDLVHPWSLGRIESSLLQGELDQLSLLGAIQRHLGSLDVATAGGAPGAGGDGVADLDTSNIVYQGTSLGGLLGAEFVALAPEIDAAYLQVPGSGIVDILTHSLIWQIFKPIVPWGAAVGELHVLTYFCQTLLDRADNTYYLDRIRERGTPVFVTYAIDDGVVGNRSTERMVSLLGLPMVGEQYGPMPGVAGARPGGAMGADGRGFRQVPTDGLYGNFAKPLLTHVEFMHPISTRTLDEWLDTRLALL